MVQLKSHEPPLLVVGILFVRGISGGHCKADKDRKTNTQLDRQVQQMQYIEIGCKLRKNHEFEKKKLNHVWFSKTILQIIDTQTVVTTLLPQKHG